jgi:hypothetical protein
MNPPPVNGMLKLGSYQGSCKITTGKKPIISRLTMKVMRVEGEAVHGRITITGTFNMAQEFSAAVNGSEIQFVTVAPKKNLTITWHGIIEGDVLKGTFKADRAGFLASLFRRKNQHGEWHCIKERFPVIRRLKTLARCSVVAGVIVAAIGGIIALIGVGSAPQPYSEIQSAGSYQTAGEYPAYSSSYQTENRPAYDSLSVASSNPQIADRDVAELGRHVYDFALDQNRVDVKGHYRGGTYVQSHDRQPPGGYSFGDQAEAAGWALGAMALVKGVQYFSSGQVEARKRAEEARLQVEKKQREDSWQRLRDHAERAREQKKQPWWKM